MIIDSARHLCTHRLYDLIPLSRNPAQEGYIRRLSRGRLYDLATMVLWSIGTHTEYMSVLDNTDST